MPVHRDVGLVAASFVGGRWIGSKMMSLHTVEGPSMLPTIEPGDRLVSVPVDGWLARVCCSSPASGLPRANSVVVIATGSGSMHCKRAVAFAGDGPTVAWPEGEPRAATTEEPYVWLLGDNASQSHDSRDYGGVPLGAVRGVCLAVVWPPHRVRLLLP